MPIPSVSSSASTQTCVVKDEPEKKCKYDFQTTIEKNTIETDVSSNDNRVYNLKKKLLLHARREDEDKVVNLTEDRLCPVSISGLYAGSKFYGTQKCGQASYEVEVELLVSFFICYFHILVSYEIN